MTPGDTKVGFVVRGIEEWREEEEGGEEEEMGENEEEREKEEECVLAK